MGHPERGAAGAAVMPSSALRERMRAREMLRSAKKRGTRERLMQKVTKKAIEKAHKKGDLDAKFRAVENAAALEAVEEQRRDAAAAGEDLSTEDAEAAFLVAQEQGADAQQVQELANAAEAQRTDYKQQIREVGARRRGKKGRKRVDGDTVRKQQAKGAAYQEKIRSRGDTKEARCAAPDTHHSLDTHGAWVADGRRHQLDYGRDHRADVVRQLRRMGITSLGDVKEIVEGGSIVGFKVEERLLPSWEGVENPVTTFEKATANAARVRTMPGAARRQSEITAEREAAGKPRNCNPSYPGSAKWKVDFKVGGRSRQIWDPEVREHLLEKGAAVKVRNKYEDHVAEGRNGKCPCQCARRVCSWLVPPKPKKPRRS